MMVGIVKELITELNQDESSAEEMLRILLKEIIIKSTRLWKASHELEGNEDKQDVEFLRKFSQLVELNFSSIIPFPTMPKYLEHHTQGTD